jgi:hypothetical protein
MTNQLLPRRQAMSFRGAQGHPTVSLAAARDPCGSESAAGEEVTFVPPRRAVQVPERSLRIDPSTPGPDECPAGTSAEQVVGTSRLRPCSPLRFQEPQQRSMITVADFDRSDRPRGSFSEVLKVGAPGVERWGSSPMPSVRSRRLAGRRPCHLRWPSPIFPRRGSAAGDAS